MAEIIKFPDRGELVPFHVFLEDTGGVRVLMKDGSHSDPVPDTELWQWLEWNLDQISPRVIEAISKAEQKRVGR